MCHHTHQRADASEILQRVAFVHVCFCLAVSDHTADCRHLTIHQIGAVNSQSLLLKLFLKISSAFSSLLFFLKKKGQIKFTYTVYPL